MEDSEAYGTAVMVPRRTARPRLAPAVVAAVKRGIRRNPRLSVRRLAVRVGTSAATVHRILRQQIKLFPYKVQLLQRLKRGDKAKRLRFCKWALTKWRSAGFQNFLFMTDEGQFHTDGTVNKQNCILWGDEKPRAHAEQELQSPSLTVWRWVGRKGILWPSFFE